MPSIGNQIKSILIVPLKSGNNLIGVLSFAHQSEDFFRDKDIKLLSLLAQQMAAARERSLIQHELTLKNNALENAQKQLRRAQERLINDERLHAVRELSVSINHEINNPLSVIIGNIQCLLFIEKDLKDKVQQRLRRVESEALKIAEINHRLLEIDRLVSETYISDGNNIRMINIEKSSAGYKNE
jgi:signal transduction histidine kinase